MYIHIAILAPIMATTLCTTTSKQLIILKLLYKFRFTTSDLLTKASGIQKSTINKRLHLLLERGYVGRNFEPEYHLLRKHASYYLLPDGIKALKQVPDAKYSPKILRNISNDKDAKDPFINHQLDVLGVYCALQAMYGDELRFFTKNQLITFEHYPQPLPDAYIRLGDGDNERQYFIDVLHEAQPFFVSTRKVMQYVAYADEGQVEWEQETGTPLPSVLLICDSPSLKKRLQKKMRRVAEKIEGNDLVLYVTAMAEIGDSSGWHDLADPDEALTLDELP
jgi:DNA-binding HxlR family transcriptional regulator